MPPTFTRDIQPALLWSHRSPAGLRLRGFHPLRRLVPEDFDFSGEGGIMVAPNPTSPRTFARGFGLPSAAFDRLYSRHRCCFLFLRVLRCFISPRSRSLRSAQGLPGQDSHSGIPGSRATCASPGLIAACHALRRRPSRAIPQVAWSGLLLLGHRCQYTLSQTYAGPQRAIITIALGLLARNLAIASLNDYLITLNL